MKIFKRKNPIQRVGDSIKDALDPSSGPSLGRSGMGSVGKTLKDARPANDKAMKAGLAAAAVTALTAASAGISSLRRRQEGAKDDS
jgi:hypothetical protein